MIACAQRTEDHMRHNHLATHLVTIVAALAISPHSRVAGQDQAVQAHETPAVMLRVMGAVGKPAEGTGQQVREQFAKDIQTVSYTARGQKVESRCVSLFTLLKAAGADVELKMGVESGKK